MRFFPNLSKVADKIVIFNLIAFEPPLVLWSIWGLTLQGEMMALPLFGLAMVLTGFGLGKCVAPLLIPGPEYRRTFVISASLANHGFTMGGVICYLAAGEKGLALSAIFLVYFVPFTFLFIFFYASMGKASHHFGWRALYNFLVNVRNMPLYAVIAAVLFGVLGIERPGIAFPFRTILAISVGLYYFTLGINFKIADLNPLKREHALLAVIKFLAIPCITGVLLLPFQLDASITRVIVIESFMPAAIYSVITAVLFNLDTRLASGLFIVNSLIFLFLVLPVLYMLYIVTI